MGEIPLTCSRCKCPECRAAAVNAVLRRVVVPCETETVDEFNYRMCRQTIDKEAWRDTVVTLNPDAEQLASDVVREMGRAG